MKHETKSECFDKLDLIKGMIENNIFNPEELHWLWWQINDMSHIIDEYIDKHKIRERE
jgi:hypothetical protein